MTCPNGFVIPDDLNSPDNWYPNRTLSECAFRCADFVAFTEEEWKQENDLLYSLVSIGFVGLVIVSTTLVIDKLRKKSREHDFFMEFLVVLLMLKALSDLIINGVPANKRLCRNNAIFLDQSDGIWNVCSVQAQMDYNVTVMMVTAWCLECIWLLCKIVFRFPMKWMASYRSYIILFVVMTPTLISGGGMRHYGSKETYGECFPDSNAKEILVARTFVLSIMTIGVLCVLIVAIYVVWYAYKSVSFVRYTSAVRPMMPSESGLSISGLFSNYQHYNSEREEIVIDDKVSEDQTNSASNVDANCCLAWPILGHGRVGAECDVDSRLAVPEPQTEATTSSWSLLKALRVPLAFVIFFVAYIVILIVFFSRADSIDDEHKMIDEWGDCVLRHYDGTDGSWVSSCGAKPDISVPRLAAVGLFSGPPLMCALCFFPRVVSQIRTLRDRLMTLRE